MSANVDVDALAGLSLFGLLVALLAACLWVSGTDWLVGNNEELTVYTMRCTSGPARFPPNFNFRDPPPGFSFDSLPNYASRIYDGAGECSGEEALGTPLHFRINMSRDEVTMLEGGELERFVNCAIFDRENWKCESESGARNLEARHGDISHTFKNAAPVSPFGQPLPADTKQVARWRYKLHEIAQRFRR